MDSNRLTARFVLPKYAPHETCVCLNKAAEHSSFAKLAEYDRFHPAFDWCLIPDVIEGTEDENNANGHTHGNSPDARSCPQSRNASTGEAATPRIERPHTTEDPLHAPAQL